MWSLSNRTGRWGFFGYSVLSGLFIGVATLLFQLAKAHHKAGPAVSALTILVIAAGGWIGLAAWVRRLHDLGWSGWWALLAVIPIVGPIQGMLLGGSHGQRGANAYGAAPGSKGKASAPRPDARAAADDAIIASARAPAKV